MVLHCPISGQTRFTPSIDPPQIDTEDAELRVVAAFKTLPLRWLLISGDIL